LDGLDHRGEPHLRTSGGRRQERLQQGVPDAARRAQRGGQERQNQ
jgi:hypothetical protein